MVFYELLDCLACKRTLLYLIEDDDGTAFLEYHIVDCLQAQKNVIEIHQVAEK